MWLACRLVAQVTEKFPLRACASLLFARSGWSIALSLSEIRDSGFKANRADAHNKIVSRGEPSLETRFESPPPEYRLLCVCSPQTHSRAVPWKKPLKKLQQASSDSLLIIIFFKSTQYMYTYKVFVTSRMTAFCKATVTKTATSHTANLIGPHIHHNQLDVSRH